MRAEKVLKYYVVCNRLKTLIRKGWKNWHVTTERLESVAEHVYGTQMLAIAMQSEYHYDVDLMKVIFMISIHEVGEAIIDDLTRYEITREEKEKMEHKAVHDIFEDLLTGEEIEALFLEFDAHETKEAKFAYQCDKLECDIQCKLYDEAGAVDLTKQKDNKSYHDPEVQELLNSGMTWSEMWMTVGQRHYGYDEAFMEVSNYAMHHQLTKRGKNG